MYWLSFFLTKIGRVFQPPLTFRVAHVDSTHLRFIMLIWHLR